MRLAIWTFVFLCFLAGSPQADRFHRLQKGETFYSLSQKYGVSIEKIQKANPTQKSSQLVAGSTIRIPQKGNQESTANMRPTIVNANETMGKYTLIHHAKTSIKQPKVSKKWKYIVIHHSGTRKGNAKVFDYYHRRIRGMENGLAYHFVIGNGTNSGDGQIETGPRWKKQIKGGHVKDDRMNEVAVGICLVGDYNSHRPSQKQIAALIELVTYLREVTGNPRMKLALHRDINITPTDCPGKYFPSQSLRKLLN